MDNTPIASWRDATVTQLFILPVFILNSNYCAFQLDEVKQSDLDSYINRRAFSSLPFPPSFNRSFIRVGKTGSWCGGLERDSKSKRAKDTLTVYRSVTDIDTIDTIENKIEMNQ